MHYSNNMRVVLSLKLQWLVIDDEGFVVKTFYSAKDAYDFIYGDKNANL